MCMLLEIVQDPKNRQQVGQVSIRTKDGQQAGQYGVTP